LPPSALERTKADGAAKRERKAFSILQDVSAGTIIEQVTKTEQKH